MTHLFINLLKQRWKSSLNPPKTNFNPFCWNPETGKFGWGGRLLKSNGGVQKVSKCELQKTFTKSVKAITCLTARVTARAETKVGLNDPVVFYGKATAQRIKDTQGITG